MRCLSWPTVSNQPTWPRTPIAHSLPLLSHFRLCPSIRVRLHVVWVPGIDADSYAAWLWELYRAVGTWLPFSEWRDDCTFDSSLAPADEDSDRDTSGGGGGDGTSDGGAARSTAKGAGRQAMAKGARARKVAATRIQSTMRGKKGRLEREQRTRAAVTLQAARRGQQARRQSGALRSAGLQEDTPSPPAPAPRSCKVVVPLGRYRLNLRSAVRTAPAPPQQRRRPPPLTSPVFTMSIRCPPPQPVATKHGARGDGSGVRRWRLPYSRALAASLPPGAFLATGLPPNLTSWQTTPGTTPRWSTIPIARPGRPRERIFSSVLPDAHAGAASYHVFGQCSPTPGLMPQVVWHAREMTFRSHWERERAR